MDGSVRRGTAGWTVQSRRKAGSGVGIGAATIGGAIGGVALIATIMAPAGVTLPRDPGLHLTVGTLIKHPLVITALCLALADAAGVAAVDLLAPLALGREGVGPTAIGIAIASGAVIGIAAGWGAGRLGERIGSFRIAMIGGIGLGLMPWILVFPLPNWAVLGVLVAIGPFFPILMTGIFPLLSMAADDLGLERSHLYKKVRRLGIHTRE